MFKILKISKETQTLLNTSSKLKIILIILIEEQDW